MLQTGTVNTIFIYRHLKDKYYAKEKDLYLPYVYLEKAFDWVPRDVVWWALRRLSMEEWLVPQYSQSVCMNAWKWVRVNETFNSWFSGSGRINSVFNVVLFIISIDALSKKLRSACSEEA